MDFSNFVLLQSRLSQSTLEAQTDKKKRIYEF